jgi:hypothetical protein
MSKLQLNFNKFSLGYLSYDGKYYTFNSDEESKKLLLKAGIKLAMFEPSKPSFKTKELPLVFKKFLPENEQKEKMLEELGLNKNDNEFDKLIKISKLNLSKDKFWLKLID